MTHSHDCETTEKFFAGSLGSNEFSGPDEYRFYVGRDVINCDGVKETYYTAGMDIGRRWAEHVTVSFNDEASDDKTILLYGMRQLENDLKDAIAFLESL